MRQESEQQLLLVRLCCSFVFCVFVAFVCFLLRCCVLFVLLCFVPFHMIHQANACVSSLRGLGLEGESSGLGGWG